MTGSDHPLFVIIAAFFGTEPCIGLGVNNGFTCAPIGTFILFYGHKVHYINENRKYSMYQVTLGKDKWGEDPETGEDILIRRGTFLQCPLKPVSGTPLAGFANSCYVKGTRTVQMAAQHRYCKQNYRKPNARLHICCDEYQKLGFYAYLELTHKVNPENEILWSYSGDPDDPYDFSEHPSDFDGIDEFYPPGKTIKYPTLPSRVRTPLRPEDYGE